MMVEASKFIYDPEAKKILPVCEQCFQIMQMEKDMPESIEAQFFDDFSLN